jgi:hypothetical protein
MPRPKMRAQQEVMAFLKRRALNETMSNFKGFYKSIQLLHETPEQQVANLINRDNKLDPEDGQYIIQADPTKNKMFIPWIYKQALNQEFIIKGGEDIEKVQNVIKEFLQFKQSPKFAAFASKSLPNISQPTNIQQYSYNQLRKVLQEYRLTHTVTKSVVANASGDILQETKGLTKVNQIGNTILWKITSSAVANKILQKSKFCEGDWCVKDPRHWKTYVGGKTETMYIIQVGNYLEYLFDLASFDFKNRYDRTVQSSEIVNKFKDLILPEIRRVLGKSQ